MGGEKVSDRHFDYDCVFVGGGLANSLLAYWLKQKQPELKLVILERNDRLGGNHTWSFHKTDLSKKDFELIEPFVSKKWEGYSVLFPKYQREIKSPYYSVRAEKLNEIVSKEVPCEFGVEIVGVAPHNVTGKKGEQWSARCVIDGRGFDTVDKNMVGYQKFVGQELELESPHGLTQPILMDVTCPQMQSFRFFYCLPWDEKRLLVEDTRYSNTGEVNLEEFRQEIDRYCGMKGWKIAKVFREEVGSLPIPLRAKYLPANKGLPDAWIQRLVPCVGVKGGFFHSTTGYSLPETVRVVSKMIHVQVKHEAVFPVVIKLAKKVAGRQWFFRLLNRMVFIGSVPDSRYKILEFFYRMPKGLINRFYAGHLWPTDYLRIFIGVPPIKVRDALGCILHNREKSHA
jgi:lycopene beta-cyclase